MSTSTVRWIPPCRVNPVMGDGTIPTDTLMPDPKSRTTSKVVMVVSDEPRATNEKMTMKVVGVVWLTGLQTLVWVY